MSGRWLRNIEDNTIYGWNRILAENPKCEEVTHEQAFPEQYVKPAARKRITAARKGKAPLVDEPIEPSPSNVDNTLDDLSLDASRGLPQ
tara:strand:- start:1817 stop:2083 length:267 start_codon:yes stop_codon:yes gene_type:complete